MANLFHDEKPPPWVFLPLTLFRGSASRSSFSEVFLSLHPIFSHKHFTQTPELCALCPDLSRCTTSKNHQKLVAKHIWADYIEQAEDFRHSQAGKESYSLRGETIERVFADAKEKHGMRYTFHRGLVRVASWVRLKFAAMNLKRLALWVFRGPVFRLFCTEFAQHSQKGCLSAV